MRIQLGGTVYTSDGKEAGRVTKLVIGPDAQTLEALVVHTGWLGHDLLVPLGSVRRVDPDATVHLSLAEEEFRRAQPFLQASFVTAETTEREPLTYLTASGGEQGALGAGLGTPVTSIGHAFDPGGGAFIGMPSTHYDAITTQGSLDEDETAITTGTRVVTSDGHQVGTLHGVRATSDGKLEDIAVSHGHFRAHQFYISADRVESADAEAVYLRLTAAQLDEIGQGGQAAGEQT